MEREVQSTDGRVWSADEFALEKGWTLNEEGFAEFVRDAFGVHGYERMQELFALRDRSLRRNVSGTFPEGADINDAMQ